MTDLDPLLARLGTLPLDPRLAGLDDRVLAGLEAARQPGMSPVMLGAMTGLAMMVGVMASALPAGRTASLAPLGVPAQLAPSSLLGDAR